MEKLKNSPNPKQFLLHPMQNVKNTALSFPSSPSDFFFLYFSPSPQIFHLTFQVCHYISF